MAQYQIGLTWHNSRKRAWETKKTKFVREFHSLNQ